MFGYRTCTSKRSFQKMINNEYQKSNNMRKINYMKLFFGCILVYSLALKYLSCKPEMKYMLLWISTENFSFNYICEGQSYFIERKCPYANCFLTQNRSYFGDYTRFDIIVFPGEVVLTMNMSDLPQKRSPHQKYVFATLESADNYPVCSNKFNGFFNWTWTYRLEPVAKWGYIVIRDAKQKVIGPKEVMHWMKLEEMKPVNEEVKSKLKQKTKAAACFMSNCYTKNGFRETFVRELQEKLIKYNLTVDVYGKCGPLKCGRDNEQKCFKLIEKKYYFYLSFENSLNKDYVTEKLLHALKNYAVPIVYGGANYTRFMPDGIYLNADDLGSEILAAKMNELINNQDQYANYFRWRNHYSYYETYESAETDDYCNFCSILHDTVLVKKTSVLQEFRVWWDPPNRCF